MVVKHLATALLGSALICAPALAQNQPASPGAAGSSSTATMGGSMTQMQPGQWRASQLEGLDIYNQNNEKIGDISEMLVDQSGKIQAVVVGVGGFLGIGERDVAIPFEQVKFVNEPRASTAATNPPTTGTTGTSGGTSATTTAPSATGSVAPNATGTMDRSRPDHAMVNMTKEQLQSMPEFRYNR